MKPYKDTSLAPLKRAEALLSEMTTEEKCMQLGCISDHEVYDDSLALSADRMREVIPDGIGGLVLYPKSKLCDIDICAREIDAIQRYLTENTRLGIPALPHVEAICGPWIFGATNYPEPIGLAATWNPAGVEQMADAIRRELRAIGYRQVLSPVMDIYRDPRWGRVGETYGEDPYLSSAMAVSYVRGIQGQDLADGVLATPKHFLGYGYPVGGLNMATQPITKRELFEVFARPFDACIHEAGAQCVMNSYGNIDGIPINESKEILTDLLRGTMDFDGFVVSDYRSINRSNETFGTAKDIKQAGVQSFNAGLDMEMPKRIAYGKLMVEAVNEGKISMAQLDASVLRVLHVKFKLGLFDNPYPAEDKKIVSAVCTPESRKLSEDLAAESAVLLKNENNLLPLRKTIKRLAVIGPNADSLRCMFAGYSAPGWIDMFIGPPSEKVFPGMEYFCAEYGIRMDEDAPLLDRENYDAFILHGMEYALHQMYPHAQTVLEALRERMGADTDITFAKGCEITGSDRSGFAQAAEIAEKADAVVMVMGGVSGWGKCGTTGEGIDSVNVGYFGVQEDLIRCIAAKGKPVVAVEISSRPISSPWTNETVPAILHFGAPGAYGGQAVADVLLGRRTPSGKLPYTVVRHLGQAPLYYNHTGGSAYSDNSIGFNADGYCDMTKYPLYYFGHGLSYTTFDYSDLRLSANAMPTDGAVDISFTVTNTGTRGGAEVAQLYIRKELASVMQPIQQLAAFAKVDLKAGESAVITFTLSANQLGHYDRAMRYVVEPGPLALQIGSSSNDIRLRAELEITGKEPREMLKERAFFAKSIVKRGSSASR